MRPPTAHTGLPAEALRRRSPNAVAVFAAHAQASDWLMPKLRPLELSDTALEPRRAHGQRRRGASAQRWRGAHSVAAAGAVGRFCSELTLRSELPPTSIGKYCSAGLWLGELLPAVLLPPFALRPPPSAFCFFLPWSGGLPNASHTKL